jgi:predicted AlkP superfamily phosphohydrolase/phosphomutase
MGAPPTSPKVLVIALDACDAGLMLELATEGECPHLAELLETGAVVDTIAPFGTFVGSSWMTITTGADVGTHRYWNWLEIDRDTYQLRSTTPRDSRRPPFWAHLSDAGRRVAVIDVPHADVPRELNGVLVKEWGCHDRHHGTASYPAELLGELEARHGTHPFGTMEHPWGYDAFAPCDYALRAGPYRSRDEERELFDALRRGIDAKRELSLELLDDGPWDLFMTVLGETHCVGHQLWHVHDVAHPRHEPATRALLGDPVVDVYRRVDASIGAHLERVGPDTLVWVQMNHGMGPHYDGDHLLDEILRRLDPRSADVRRGGRATAAVRRSMEVLPERARTAGLGVAARAVRWRADASPPPPSGTTRPHPEASWFRIPGNTTVAPIRLNIEGRERSGVLRRGPELDALVDRLEADLRRIVNLDTGRPAVRAVVRADDVLERRDDDALPDLFVEWDRSAPIERVWSPATGTIAVPYENWRTGDHNDRGLVVVRGPGVGPGRRPSPMSLVDVAPTICAALGAPMATDGAVHQDLLPTSPAARADGALTMTPLVPKVSLGRDRPRDAQPDTAAVASAALDLAGEGTRRALDAQAHIAHDEAELTELRRRVDDLTVRLETLERERNVWATMAWLADEPIVESALVSVITPTHRRPEVLRHAIESVIAQRYPRWELVVVDDGSDTAKSVVADLDDDRVTYLSIPHGGPCAARNAGLDAATGSLIAYLDDDNVLDPAWLQAVVWAFANHPGHQALYGARLIDDWDRVHGRPAGGWPWMQFEAWDRARLERANIADMGVVAHRASAPGARFDESFWECGDWDFFLSLTEHQDPLELPAIAVSYRSDGADRLTGRFVDHEDAVRGKWAARRGAASSR